MGKIIDGKKLAAQHEELLKNKIAKLGFKPKMVSILVGDDPASVLYSQIKQNKAAQVGIDFDWKRFPADSQFQTIAEEITRSNNDDSVNGIMVQLPFPEAFLRGYNKREILGLIDPRKDVDGLTGQGPFPPAAVGAVLSIFEDEGLEINGKKAVVVGASDLVGKPMAKELENFGAEVITCNSKTANLAAITRKADILISGVGKPGLISGEMVKDGAIVVDVGTKKVGNKVMGDIDFNSVLPKVTKITPVPGGVGPMTVITLLENLYKLSQRSEEV